MIIRRGWEIQKFLKSLVQSVWEFLNRRAGL